MNINEKLLAIQTELKAPKNLKNSFGGYNYRNVESIFEAVKPLLDKYKATLTLEDHLHRLEDRFYVQAIATFRDTESMETIIVPALAREQKDKKGMDEAQITGACSSYARKYALNGLFLLDDTKDPDTDEYTKESEAKSETRSKKKAEPKETTSNVISPEEVEALKKEGKRTGTSSEKLKSTFKVESIRDLTKAQYTSAMNKMSALPTVEEGN